MWRTELSQVTLHGQDDVRRHIGPGVSPDVRVAAFARALEAMGRCAITSEAELRTAATLRKQGTGAPACTDLNGDPLSPQSSAAPP